MVISFQDFQEKYCSKCGLNCSWQWDDEEEGIGHCVKGEAQEIGNPYDTRYCGD